MIDDISALIGIVLIPVVLIASGAAIGGIALLIIASVVFGIAEGGDP